MLPSAFVVSTVQRPSRRAGPRGNDTPARRRARRTVSRSAAPGASQLRPRCRGLPDVVPLLLSPIAACAVAAVWGPRAAGWAGCVCGPRWRRAGGLVGGGRLGLTAPPPTRACAGGTGISGPGGTRRPQKGRPGPDDHQLGAAGTAARLCTAPHITRRPRPGPHPRRPDHARRPGPVVHSAVRGDGVAEGVGRGPVDLHMISEPRGRDPLARP
jgi:hypothetical protein